MNPLRYRGYYYDSDTNLYYLQSRYYDPNIGRFINADEPIIMYDNQSSILENNLYSYCENNPIMFVDPSGYYRAYIFSIPQFYNKSYMIQDRFKSYFKSLSCSIFTLNKAKTFTDKWNSIKSADVIVISAHSDPTTIFDNLSVSKVRKLKRIDCKVLLITGCNSGHQSFRWSNLAYEFSKKITGVVLASDGTVYSGEYPTFDSKSDEYFKFYLPTKNKKKVSRKHQGWILYQSFYSKDKKVCWTSCIRLGLKSITMPNILDYLKKKGYVKF